MKRLATLTCAAALAISFSAVAQEGTLKKIKDSGSITIGHRDADFWPRNEQGSLVHRFGCPGIPGPT